MRLDVMAARIGGAPRDNGARDIAFDRTFRNVYRIGRPGRGSSAMAPACVHFSMIGDKYSIDRRL
jgi:hypothetical protein